MSLAELLDSIISMHPPAGASFEAFSDTVSRLYSTGISCPMTLPFPWFMHDSLKSLRVLSPHWLSLAFDQNGLKCMADTKFYLEQLSGRIGCFKEITVLIVQLNELGEVDFV